MWTNPFHSEILAKSVGISRLGWACSVCACSSQNLRWWPHSSGLWLVYDLCLNSRRMRRLSCLCPHCRTVCHCSRPSCRRHARLLPGHCIAGAHLPGGGAEESGQDRTLSCTCPFQGPIWAWGSAVLCDRRGGTRSAPGTPEGGEPAPEQPPELSDSALRASGSSAKHSPRPGAAPRLAAPPPWGPHAPPRSPAVRAEPRLPQAVRLLGLRLRPAPPCVRGFPGEGAAATCCGAPSEQRLVARRCSPAGRTFVSARRLLSPPSVNHSWSPREEGRPGDARPFKGAARLFRAPAPGPRQGSGSPCHSRTLRREGPCCALCFLWTVGFKTFFEFPWSCLQKKWPICDVY